MTPLKTMKEEIGKIGCKFCHYKFFLPETLGNEYVNHLWRFHKDKILADLQEVNEEIRRIENLPK